ncbi:MAG: FMN-binding protein [candidate division WOR-3 bacterium]|nr:FMN-binding protein [candidate division WOR-3 bacterium]MCX7948238.1 FMN-binding protein [candidate division WOR-3 bacterium]MDW8150040.1 FMN-binding protein [candidate division WOR-3 bacterium]
MLFFLLAQVFLKKEEAIKLAFKECKIDSFILTLDKNIKQELKNRKMPLPLRDTLIFYFGCDKVALIDDIIGKHLPITYMVTLKKNGKVDFVEILVYRESYGGEIKNKNFLIQFEDKSINDSLRPKKEIKNIAGATISVNSITYAIKRTLFLYENYVKYKIK